MSVLGLDTFCLAPEWEPALIEPEVERLQEAGVRLIEVPVARPSRIDVRRAHGLARSFGLDLAPSLVLPATLDVLAEPDAALERLEPTLRMAAEWGAFGVAGMVYDAPGRRDLSAAGPREIDALCRYLERAGKAARSIGVKLAIQPANRYETRLVNRAADAVRLIERIGIESLCLHLDTAHMLLEEESLAAALGTAEPFLAYVTLAESHRGVPGKGMMDWKVLFSALSDIGFRGPATVSAMVRFDAETAAARALWRAAARHPAEIIEEGVPFLREQARAAGFSLG